VVKLEEVLRLAIEMNATDIHVQVGLPPMFRVRGKLVTHESDALTAEQCEALVYSIMSEDQKKTFSVDSKVLAEQQEKGLFRALQKAEAALRAGAIPIWRRHSRR